ncbi:MAG: S-layer homology domain-containing protein [Butyricicoccaceae bacterium]
MFTDKSKISSYATSYVAEAVSQGYINGYTDGTFKPQGNLKRGEIAKILYFYLGSSLSESGRQYTAAAFHGDTKNVTISAACTLSDATIEGEISTSQRACSPATSTSTTSPSRAISSSAAATSRLDGVTAMNLIVSNPMGIKPTVTRDRLDQYRHRRGAVLRLAL